MNKTLILYIAAIAMGVAACHKPAEPAVVKVTTSDTTYNLVNNSARVLKVDMYTSRIERENRTNLRFSCEVPANGVYKIPFARLDTSLTTSYYYDVYAPDFSYANWASYSQGFVLFQSGHSFNLNILQLTQAGYYFLNGGSDATQWIAVDKRDNWNNTSVWTSLENYAKYMQVQLRRDQDGSVSRKQFDGTITTEHIQSMSADSTFEGFSRLSVYTAGSNQYTLYNTSVIPSFSTDYRKSRDTLVMNDGSGYYWVMVRQ